MNNAAAAPWAEIDLAALQHNWLHCRSMAPENPFMAVVKADAYGHGMVDMAKALLTCKTPPQALAVARLSEAEVLRQAGARGNLVVLEGVASAAELRRAIELQLQLVIHDLSQLRLFNELRAMPSNRRQRPLAVWLKLDTGMHRLGLPRADVEPAWQQLRASSLVSFKGWMTHFACADECDNPLTAQQLVAAQAVLEQFPAECSWANSAALWQWPDARQGWIRPGISLYGCAATEQPSVAELQLQPVMSLKSRLHAVHNVPAGQGVGYGQAWQASCDSIVGIVAIGYGDGYPRHAPNGTPVLVAGHEVPLVGRVSMDKLAVDLTSIADLVRADSSGTDSGGADSVAVGSEVTLWGRGLPADKVAAAVGTIGYELVTRVAPRVPRVFVGQ